MEQKDAKEIAVVHDEKGKAVDVVKVGPKPEEKKDVTKTALKAVPKKEVKTPPVPKSAAKPAATPKPEKKPKPVKAAKPAAKVEKPVEPVMLRFPRPDFQKNLVIAADFTASGKSTMPVLTHILFESDGQGHCKLVATDLEVIWTKVIKCKGPKVARCIPAALLVKEVKALPSTELEIVLEFKQEEVNVNGRCKLFTLKADNFPVAPVIEKFTELQIDNLNNALKSVVAAIGAGDSRYALTGAYLDFEAGKAVATDGHRMHIEDIRIRGEKVKSVIVPHRAVTLMIKHPQEGTPELLHQKAVLKAGTESPDKPCTLDLDVFGHSVKVDYKPDKYGVSLQWSGPINEASYQSRWKPIQEAKKGIGKSGSVRGYLQALAEEMYLTHHKTVAITVSEKHITYPAAGGELIIRAIDGNFPNYAQVFPKKSPIMVSFSADSFLQNLAGAVPLQDSVTLKINSKLTIETKSADLGDFKWQIPCKSEGKDQGAHIDLKFNTKYLIEALRSYPSAEVILEVTESMQPCVLNRKALIMPMRLQ